MTPSSQRRTATGALGRPRTKRSRLSPYNSEAECALTAPQAKRTRISRSNFPVALEVEDALPSSRAKRTRFTMSNSSVGLEAEDAHLAPQAKRHRPAVSNVSVTPGAGDTPSSPLIKRPSPVPSDYSAIYPSDSSATLEAEDAHPSTRPKSISSNQSEYSVISSSEYSVNSLTNSPVIVESEYALPTTRPERSSLLLSYLSDLATYFYPPFTPIDHSPTTDDEDALPSTRSSSVSLSSSNSSIITEDEDAFSNCSLSSSFPLVDVDSEYDFLAPHNGYLQPKHLADRLLRLKRLRPPRRSRLSHSAPSRPAPSDPSLVDDSLRGTTRDPTYVEPWRWTPEHLELLNCEFAHEANGLYHLEKLASGLSHGPGSGSIGGDIDDMAMIALREHEEAASTSIATAIHATAKDLCYQPRASSIGGSILDFLRRHGLSRFRYDPDESCDAPTKWDTPYMFSLPLHFDNRTTARLPIDGGLTYCTDRWEFPTLAYLNLDEVRSRRNVNQMKRAPCGKRDLRADHALNMKRDGNRPANVEEDPFIVAVLIAIAQGQRERQEAMARAMADDETASSFTEPLEVESPASSVGPDMRFKAHLLALHPDEAGLYFYSARIPSSLLDQLDNPATYGPREPVIISCHHIPIKTRNHISVMMRKLFPERFSWL